jgi:hypothetical protein
MSETIIRQVRDIDAADRRALEHVIGRQLSENQKVIFQVVSLGGQPEAPATHDGASPGQLPAWCNVFDGMSDREIEDVDRVIRERANLTRPTE